MARPAKPWYWKARKTWCVYHKGERIPLGPDRAEALRQYHQIMAKPEEKRQPVHWGAVAAILDDFLTWTEENRAPKTFTRYKRLHSILCQQVWKDGVPADLNPSHVTTWLNSHKGWNSTTKRNAITALQRGFNWAVKNRGLDRNPIPRHGEARGQTTHDRHHSPRSSTELLDACPTTYRSAIFSSSRYDSGSRPQETKQLEARHLQLDKQRAVIPGEEAKGGRTRAIYFPTERSLEIIKRLANEHPTGPLFRNNKGNAWTGFAVKLRFDRIQIALGRQEMAETRNHFDRYRGRNRKLAAKAIQDQAKDKPPAEKITKKPARTSL